jgi:hypothetical protein
MKKTLLSLLSSATLALAQGGLVLTPPPTLLPQQQLTIVSIGDDFASGEGNPDSVDASGVAHWTDKPCHRSANNGPHFAAEQVNQLNNVDTFFVDFSCSGAGILNGVLNATVSTEPGEAGTIIPAQIDSVANWQQTHKNTKIDVLIITVGANDVGYQAAVNSCMQSTSCVNNNAVQAAVANLGFVLPQQLAALNTAIHQRLNVGRIYLMPYANPYHNEDGPLCDSFQEFVQLPPTIIAQGPIFATENLTQAESSTLESRLLFRLNAQLSALAPLQGWEFVDGAQDTFRPHGFCNAPNQRWINTVADSVIRQGDIRGTMRPNLLGHRAYADSLVALMTQDFNLPFQPATITELYEFNDGLSADSHLALENHPFRIQAEIRQTADQVTVELHHRVRDLFGLFTTPFSITPMTDIGQLQLGMFTAVVPGIPSSSKIDYFVVVKSSRNGVETTTSSNTRTIVVGQPLLH